MSPWVTEVAATMPAIEAPGAPVRPAAIINGLTRSQPAVSVELVAASGVSIRGEEKAFTEGSAQRAAVSDQRIERRASELLKMVMLLAPVVTDGSRKAS